MNNIIVLNENHLRNVLREYTNYYNLSRQRQGISQHFHVSGPEKSTKGLIKRQDILGGILHNYFRQTPAPISACGQNFSNMLGGETEFREWGFPFPPASTGLVLSAAKSISPSLTTNH